MKLVSALQMRALEQRADASGNSFAAMMERAGTLSAQAILERHAVRGKHILVLVGPGNNGGDGLVCARVFHDAGAQVALYVWRRVPMQNDVNWELCMQRGIAFTRAEDDAAFTDLREKIARAEIIIDALLGTGVARPIEGVLKNLLDTARAALTPQQNIALISPAHPGAPSPHYKTVVAIDLPTGLNPDTGALDAAALRADLTITFAFPKSGHYAFPGADAVGELLVADIGIPESWADEIWLDVATAAELRAHLPARPRNSNKGTFGKAMLACGSQNFTGAPVLAARAAGRVGAGLVTLAVPQSIHAIIASKIDEATFLPLPDRLGEWRPRGASDLLAQLWDSQYDALLIGCGLGQSESTRDFLARLLENFNTLENPPALVLDADALNLVATIPEWWKTFALHVPPILTPHPGEMARLLNTDIASVQKNRVETARDAAHEWNAVVVLKGAFTIIAAPDGRVMLLPFANAALASAGTGDVLAGAIAGFAAQLCASAQRAGNVNALHQAFDAAVLGAYAHALAGEIAAHEIGSAGVVAGDLLPRLPQAIRMLGE